jgi:putative addiction module CopG family antidote
MELSLRPDLEEYVRGLVETGQYASESEVINTALEALRAREEWDLSPEQVDELRRQIDPALAELDRGEGRPWNVDELKARVREDTRRRRRGH